MALFPALIKVLSEFLMEVRRIEGAGVCPSRSLPEVLHGVSSWNARLRQSGVTQLEDAPAGERESLDCEQAKAEGKRRVRCKIEAIWQDAFLFSLNPPRKLE